MTGRPAVFLDRDGVLNDSVVIDGVPHPPSEPSEVMLLPGVEEACIRLHDAGLLLICVSNQPDLARGSIDHSHVEAINSMLRERLPIDDIVVCPHDDADACSCRKPLPGMLVDSARRWAIDLHRSVMVGDRWRDVAAGHAAGCATVYVDRGYGERGPRDPDHTVRSLAEAVPWIMSFHQSQPNPRRDVHMVDVRQLRVRIFADGADPSAIIELARNPVITGFTTNPTLMRAAGITDYEAFAGEVLKAVPDMPISFEVFADDFDEMERQALKIASWGDQVYVKVPVTNTSAQPSARVISRLAEQGVKLNITALMTVEQVRWVADCLAGGPPAFISVFAGRIADTGRDPLPIMAESLAAMTPYPNLQLIWASPREVLNVIQADAIGCHVITVTRDLLSKLPLLGKDLGQFSLETVRMFHGDAARAGFSL